MRIDSPLSNITEVLSQIRNSAEQYRPTLRKNEAATRAVLIDPVLRALGWDISNTFMVEVEKTFEQARADYALYDSNGAVKIIVEAKALGEDLAHQRVIMSLVTYAFTFQLEDVFLTDGLIWHHYTNFKPGNVVPIRTIDIASDDPVDSAAYLVQRLDAAKFWPEERNIDTLAQQVAQLESIVASLQQELTKVKQVETVGRPTQHAASSASTPLSKKEKFIELKSITDVTGTKPTHFRLPSGEIIEVKVWRDVLRECCKFALRNNPDISIPLPDRSARKVSLVSAARPAMGIAYLEEKYNGQQIYIYTNYDANNCVANSVYILSMVPAEKIKIAAAVVFE
jgi:predicted type IV restriction endonuclease